MTDVNQWHFCSSFNQVRNLELFLISSSCPGSEILRQFLHVTMCLSLIQIIVYGVAMDASGLNTRFARYLLHDKNKVVNGNIQQTYGINVLLGALYKIYVWFCSTHNVKNVRNQLLASSGTAGAPLVFRDSKYVPFGWTVIKDQWKREVERINQQQAPETDLSESAIFPDSWNKMRVTHAKAVFSEKLLPKK